MNSQCIYLYILHIAVASGGRGAGEEVVPPPPPPPPQEIQPSGTCANARTVSSISIDSKGSKYFKGTMLPQALRSTVPFLKSKDITYAWGRIAEPKSHKKKRVVVAHEHLSDVLL